MERKIKRVIIAGKGASGKDHLRKLMESRGFKYCISHTTRPKRDNELEGEDYYFIDKSKAAEMVVANEFYEHVVFNDWLYGTSKKEFDSSNLFIMTPRGISNLKHKDRESSLIIYLDIDENIRLERLTKRNDTDASGRRIKADYLDFYNFSDYDLVIKDPSFTPDCNWCNLKIINND